MKPIIPGRPAQPAFQGTATHAPNGDPLGASKPVHGAPPPDIEDNELVHMLTVLPRPHEIVPYPRKMPGGSDEAISHLAIVATMPDDKIRALAAAHQFTRLMLADPKKLKEEGKTNLSPEDVASQGYAKILQNEATLQLLYRMCKKAKRKNGSQERTKDDYELALNTEGKLQDAFPGVPWMRVTVPDDEIAVLIAAYHRVQLNIGPIVAELSEAACDLWLEKLIAGGSRGDPLDSLGSEARTDLVMRSVFHLRNYRRGNFSFGGLPESGSSGSGSSMDPSPEDAEEDVVPPELEDVEPPQVEGLSEDPTTVE